MSASEGVSRASNADVTDERSSRWRVRAAIAPLLGDAKISGAITSQLLAGELLQELESRGDWLRVRGADGYEGWTHAGYLMAATGDEATWHVSLGVTVKNEDGRTHDLPLGARVAPSCEIVRGDALSPAQCAERFPRSAAAAATTALELFRGASYQWGGVTPWGCDCSGLVQRAFALHGFVLPRDAWQQATHGRDVARDAAQRDAAQRDAAQRDAAQRDAAQPDAMHHEPGDLLFFTDREDRRVTHVGISLGASHMVHSALARGGVAVERMNSDDAYVARLRANCTGVRRVSDGPVG